MMHVQVFLSYASEDRSLAELVRQKLEDCGFAVWTDEPSRPGRSVSELIASGINSSDAFVVILGKGTPERQWTSLEIGGAVASGKPIVPLLTNREANVPFLLRDVQYLDLSDRATQRQQLERLCEALRETPRRQGAALGRELVEETSRVLQHQTLVYKQALASFERRRRRAQLLAALVSVIAVAIALITVSSEVSSVVISLVAGLGALVASMLGFYFGAEGRRRQRDSELARERS